jgi:elongation factor P
MAMLEYNEVRERKFIIHEGEPFECLSSHVFRKQQRKPVNATKLRSLLTGRIVEHSFHVSDKVEEAELSKRELKYLYFNKGEYWFCEVSDPSKRFKLDEALVGPAIRFIKPNSIINALIFDEKIIGVKVPVKVELKVTEAADAVKGNTISGGTKIVTVETGATVNVPMFINEGEVIRINTESGDYVERVGK